MIKMKTLNPDILEGKCQQEVILLHTIDALLSIALDKGRNDEVVTSLMKHLVSSYEPEYSNYIVVRRDERQT